MATRPGLFGHLAPPMALGLALLPAGLAAGIQALPGMAAAWSLLELLVLVAAVFASVSHADVIAHRTGEPFGTLILTIAVMVIEVSLIVAVMAGGDGSPTLARDTVFAVVMLVCNGLVGLCLVAGGMRHGEQGFSVAGAGAYLVVLMPLATLTLILPNFTISAPGPVYSWYQLAYVVGATILLYGVFLYVQTVRHTEYFLSDAGGADTRGAAKVTTGAFLRSLALLVTALLGVVLLAKHFAATVEVTVARVGAPEAMVGLLVAVLVLLPESLAALRAARRNQLQKSINLALGSSLATIGLTVPAVAAVSFWLGKPLVLGLEPPEMVLLVLTFAVSIVSVGGGRSNILPGFVHLVIFATTIVLIFAP